MNGMGKFSRVVKSYTTASVCGVSCVKGYARQTMPVCADGLVRWILRIRGIAAQIGHGECIDTCGTVAPCLHRVSYSVAIDGLSKELSLQPE